MAEKEKKIYSVTEVNLLIKAALQARIPEQIIIAGEITDWKIHHSGHCYFSLKDEDSKLPCVMWAGRFGYLKFVPENGMAVIARGQIDVYTAGGKYQFYAEKMEPEGIGALQLAFEQMIRRLQEQGLFEEAHKKALPPFPERVGILTSESGAAIGDIIQSIHSRWPCVKLYLYPVAVQGEGAAEEIAAAVRDVNRRNDQLKLDLLIVGRGGGSMEDLWAFNEEVLARAIYESKIPVISAVGHEYDTTIADLVADARASTPTKAGVVAVPEMREVMSKLSYLQENIESQIRWQIQLYRENLQSILASAVFKRPLLPVRNAEQQVDEFTARLGELIKKYLFDSRSCLQEKFEKVARIEPHRLLGKKKVELGNLMNRTVAAIKAVTNDRKMELAAQSNRLIGLNPKTVLKRGYSITTNTRTGDVVSKLRDVEIGDLLTTELAEKKLIESRVTKK